MQLGLVLRNVRLTEELLARLEDLQASRRRLVAAQDLERRRLERNIHDGAQQQLVALAVKIRLARQLGAKDPEKASDLLEQTEREVAQALDDLRDLARGIFPPLLADQGLVGALQARPAGPHSPHAPCEVASRQARKHGCNEWCPLAVRHVEVESATLTWVAKSEELGFEEFFRAEYSGLVRSVYLLTADLAEAEELAQEAMARVFERWDRVKVMESAAGYVYRTAVNLNRKRLRHLAVRARRVLAMSSRGDEGSEPETRADFASAMASLPVGQRQAFMLTEWLGLSADEAGQMLGVAPSSVRSRVHRAKTTLRKLLEVSVEDRG